jgi:3-isopropylmalate/(R)-2-methylmalate dehydratase large subunit
MTGMTMVEKILAAHAGLDTVRPGDLAVVDVDTAVVLDLNFYDGQWAEPVDVFDPDRVVIILDHIVPAPDKQSAEFLRAGSPSGWASRGSTTWARDRASAIS